MGAIAILLGLGISVFLLWFFESIISESASDEITVPERPVHCRNARKDDSRDAVWKRF